MAEKPRLHMFGLQKLPQEILPFTYLFHDLENPTLRQTSAQPEHHLRRSLARTRVSLRLITLHKEDKNYH